MRTVLEAWADNAVEFARVLRRQDPTWPSETFDLAGGRAALCGPGMWINGAYAVGFDGSITADELDDYEHRCAVVGVRPTIEVSPLTPDEMRDLISRRGYIAGKAIAVLRRSLDDIDELAPADPAIVVEPAGDQITMWQEISALGWGHPPEMRRANDAFSRVAAAIDGDGFVLARAANDRRPVGCASMTIRDAVATLGGMSTVPQERRRGVQSALIRHRLRVSAEAGCQVAVSTTVPGGDSERNLIRHGFEPWFEVTVWVLEGPGDGR